MIDLFKLGPEQLERFIHLQSLIARQQEEAEKVISARAYYSGDHPVLLSARQIEYLGAQLTTGAYAFNHNLVKTVIDTLRERLNVTGFTVNGRGAGSETEVDNSPEAKLAGLLWSWWKQNRMESQQIRLYRRALRDGLAYVMVDYDNDYQRPRFALHEVDDGVTGISLHRDQSDENCTLFSTRYFTTFDPLTVGETGKQRKTVYLPSQIRKYINVGANTWIETRDAEDLEWPIPWLDIEGKPMGVATIEFQNPGGSEVGLLAGLQNALNKAWLDLLAAADMSGFPILTANYREQALQNVRDDDPNQTGKDEFKISPARLIEIFGGTIGRIEGANLDHMIKLVWTTVDALSGVSRTPASFMRPFSGVDVPSGEALKQLESGLVAKAKERQLVFGESWADAMGLAIRVARKYGRDIPKVKDPIIGVQWAEAATRMEKTEAEIAKILKELGLPDQAVWERAGFSPEQIASFVEILAKKRQSELSSIVTAMNQPTAPQPATPTGGTVAPVPGA